MTMGTAMPPAEFLGKLRNQVRQDNFLQGPHPLTTMLLAGELRVEELRAWSVQWYLRTQAFTRGIAYMFAKCPDLSERRKIAENIYEEETGRISGTKPHVELFADLAMSVGVTREELDTAVPLPCTRAFVEYIDSLAARSFAEVVAAMAIGSEAQSQDGVERLTSALRGYGADTTFFDLHIELDEEHAEIGDDVIESEAATTDVQDRMTHAVEEHLRQYRRWNDGIFEAVVKPRLDTSAP